MTQRCSWCGREYDTEVPRCETCGHERFEEVSGSSPFESDSFVWICTNCGREHVKRSPPCSRCGNHDLQKQSADSDDVTDDVSVPGYLSVGKPYLAGIVVVLAIVALAITGVVPIPGVSDPPDPPAAPGDADQYAGLDLALVESELHERFETERRQVASSERERDPGLDAFAEYATRHHVAERYDPDYDGSVPDPEAFDPQCSTSPVFGIAEPEVDLAAAGDEAVAANDLSSALLENPTFGEAVREDERGFEGIYVHVGPDGSVFVGYVAC